MVNYPRTEGAFERKTKQVSQLFKLLNRPLFWLACLDTKGARDEEEGKRWLRIL